MKRPNRPVAPAAKNARRILLGSILALFATTTPQLRADTLFTYTFSDVVSGTSNSSAGGNAFGITFGTFTSVGASATVNAGGRFSFTSEPLGATNGSDTFTGGINLGVYDQVTLTPQAGYTLNLDSITFTLQRSGTGIRQYSVRSSLDTYGANLSASISPANANLSVVNVPQTNIFQVVDSTTSANTGSTITLGAAYDALTSAVTFRFYGFNAESTGGTFSIDDVAFIGSTVFAGAHDLTWNPGANANWNTTDSNWLNGASSSTFTNLDNVTFTDAGLTNGATVTVDAGGVTAGNINIQNTTGTYTIAGGSIAGTGTLAKSNNGTFVLGTTFGGPISVAGGTMKTAASNLIGDTSSVSVGSGALLDLNGNNDTVGTVAMTGGTITSGTGTLVSSDITSNNDSVNGNFNNLSGNYAIGSSVRSVNTGTGSVLNIDAKLTGSAGGRFQLTGTGTVNFTGDNSGMAGNVQLNTGVTLQISSPTSLGSAQFFWNGGTLKAASDLTGANAIPNSVSLGGDVAFGGSNPIESSGAWTFFQSTSKTITANVPVTISGNITGATGAATTFTGAGLIKLNGSGNNFTSMTVDAAEVQVNGSTTLASGASVINGGTLSGNGTIVGATTITAGTLNPTASGGDSTLTISGALSLGSSGIYVAQVSGTGAGQFDQLSVSGNITIDPSAGLTIDTGGGTFAPGLTFQIIDNTGANPISGSFFGKSEGTVFSVLGGQEFQITYAGGDGNDVVLTSVPEPGTLAALLGGFGVLALRRSGSRRRK